MSRPASIAARMPARTDSTVTCPACGASLPPTAPSLRGTDKLHGTPGAFTVAVCGSCGSGVTLPRVAEDELGGFYPESYNAYALPDHAVLRGLATALFRWRYWRGLRRPPFAALSRRAPGRLLDVGGGRGDLGVVLRSRGWDVTSLEPSAAACAESSARGVETVQGTLTRPVGELRGPYDAVVFQHSLEHVVDPAADLRAARELLADGGLLLISVPNFGSWQRRRFGSDWFHLDLPRHRVHFTPDGLESALRRAGFEQVELATSTSADGLPMSVQYRRLGRRLEGGRRRLAAAGASLAAAPLTAGLDAAAGAGDFLHAMAVRPPRA
jgi:SAM-dependent methyltransferase